MALILDEMATRRMWSRQVVNYSTGRVVVLGADKGVAAQWLLAHYGPQVCSLQNLRPFCQLMLQQGVLLVTGTAEGSREQTHHRQCYCVRTTARHVRRLYLFKQRAAQSSRCRLCGLNMQACIASVHPASRSLQHPDVPLHPQVTLAILLAVCAAMMGAFLGYHVVLLRSGMTTSETFKWRDLRLALGEQLYGDGDGGRWRLMLTV